ncbi:hypothetical protein BH23ACT12_BH23ACT12_02850 [soil metagenome]
MVSERINRFRYRLNTRRYELKRENTLRMARMRYRLDNMAAGSAVKVTFLVLLGATPFILYMLMQPDTPTTIEDPVSTISRNVGPPAPLVVPVPTPSPAPSLEPAPTASPTPSPSPSRRPAPQCSNGRDDDGDGRTDFPADKGCSSRTDRTESPDPRPTPPPAPEPPPPPPPRAPASQPVPPPPPQCDDGFDNDGDGRVDFDEDFGCSSRTDNDETGPPTPSPPTPTSDPTPTPTETTSAQGAAPALLENPELESLIPGSLGPLMDAGLQTTDPSGAAGIIRDSRGITS